jgi:hypothetical protein
MILAVIAALSFNAFAADEMPLEIGGKIIGITDIGNTIAAYERKPGVDKLVTASISLHQVCVIDFEI